MKKDDYKPAQLMIKDVGIAVTFQTKNNGQFANKPPVYFPLTTIPYIRQKNIGTLHGGRYLMAFCFPSFKQVEIPLNQLQYAGDSYYQKPEVVKWLEECRLKKMELDRLEQMEKDCKDVLT